MHRPDHLATRLVGLGALVVLGGATCPTPHATPVMGLKSAAAHPLFRCPKDDLEFTWALTGDGKMRVMAFIPWNGADREADIYFTTDDSGAAHLSVADVENQLRSGNNGQGYNFGDSFRLPPDFTIKLQPMANSEDPASYGEPRTFNIHTFFGAEEFQMTALRRHDADPPQFHADFQAPEWSSNLRTDQIRLTRGCTDPLSGTYAYDKGPATPDARPLTSDDDFTDTMSVPVPLQGTWVIKAPDTCPKSVQDVGISVRVFCPN